MKRIFNIDDIKKNLLVFCSELGRIPTKDEITKCSFLPNPSIIRNRFKEIGYFSYIDFCKENGYKTKNPKSPYFSNMTYDELCLLYDNYFLKNNKYPTSVDCQKDFNLPTWNRIKEICGERFDEFKERYGLCKCVKDKPYEYYCKLFIEESKRLNRPLTGNELDNHNEYSGKIPNTKWLIANCPDKNVKNYNDFIYYLGFKPRYNIPKEYAVKAILKKFKELNRPLMYDDFRNPNGIDEIGISTINKIWGTFNKMLKDLSLPINQEDMIHKHRNIDELVNDIKRLCKYIEEVEDRKNITVDDINNCEWCLNAQSYQKYFKDKLNLTLSEYIKSIGYIPNEPGMGMNYQFEDGEIVKSQWEYQVSKYFKEEKIYYERNLKYKDFIPTYNGNKDCDYIVTRYNKVWYIEIAGMLDREKMNKNKDDRIHKKYRRNLKEKEKMLKDNNLNYKIIYPHDLRIIPLPELFSFLFD